jgi:hypothetical protein
VLRCHAGVANLFVRKITEMARARTIVWLPALLGLFAPMPLPPCVCADGSVSLYCHGPCVRRTISVAPGSIADCCCCESAAPVSAPGRGNDVFRRRIASQCCYPQVVERLPMLLTSRLGANPDLAVVTEHGASLSFHRTTSGAGNEKEFAVWLPSRDIPVTFCSLRL